MAPDLLSRKNKGSRWPKEASSWNGAKRAAYAKEISKRFPDEDPEYGMPDGSED